jgi:hypothetical protein
MKTAISMGLSRSRLFAIAVAEYVKRRRDEQMLRQLNKVYSAGDAAEKRVLKGIKAKFSRTIKGAW